MEYIQTALIVLLVVVLYQQYKRIRYIERDVTSLSRNQDNKEKSTLPPYQVKIDISDQPKNPIVDEIVRKEAHRLAELEDNKLDPKLRKAARLAIDIGWDIIDHQENIKMLRVARQHGSAKIKGKINKGAKKRTRNKTVTKALKHKTKGKTQLFRKHVTLEELREILQNPRAHSGKGYYKK